jgi:two-component system NarL family response regulator
MQPPEGRITVLVVDDDGDFRAYVAALLAQENDIAVVGEAADGAAASTLVLDLVPDVVLLDLSMPSADGGNRGGIEAAGAISERVPTAKVVMLTGSAEEDDVYEALRAGASGYLVKNGSLGDLAGAVRTLAHGLGLVLPPSIASKVLAQFKAVPPTSTNPGLSERELEVLGLVGQGHTNDQIAERLFLSSHTVKRHLANILAKLHQRSRADAVAYAVRNGYLAERDTAAASVAGEGEPQD